MSHPVAVPPRRFPPEVKALHAALSAQNVAFLDFVERVPEASARIRFEPFEESPFIDYPLHAWPTLIDARRRERMAAVAHGMCRLIKRGPRLLLGEDPARIAAYYGLDPDRAHAAVKALALTDDARGAMGRGDFVEDAADLKCLEFNLSAGLGGWETAIQVQQVMDPPVMQRFLSEQGLRIRPQDTLRAFLANILQDVRRSVDWEGECNIGILFPDADKPDAGLLEMSSMFLNAQYGELLQEEGARGEVLLTTFGELEDAPGHRFTVGGRRLHGLIEFDARDRLEVSGPTFAARARAALAARTVCLYNGPAGDVLDDKRNLALLSEHAESPALSAEERELIRRHLPWSRRLERTEVTRDGHRVRLPELLASRREELVIKAGRGYGGMLVRVGQATPAAEWDAAVRDALDQGGWIVQERIDSRPYHYLGEDGAVAPHTVIWGLFVCGDLYGGGMVRVAPQGRGSGVINALQGATLGALVEVE